MPEQTFEAGCPVPSFKGRTGSNPEFAFDAVAGRHVVLYFFGSAAHPVSATILKAIYEYARHFDDTHLSFFGVTQDEGDECEKRIADREVGIRFFRDFGGTIGRQFGAIGKNGEFRQIVYLLDPALRVMKVFMPEQDIEKTLQNLKSSLEALPDRSRPYLATLQAPVLIVPRIFEPELCTTLIDYYEKRGGVESGFMRDIDGKTRLVSDPRHKRRKDCAIESKELQQACTARLGMRLAPEIAKAFQFHATRVERQLVACYDAADAGHFRAHRDNTTKGTAHRRFAVSLFLNAGEFEGGFLRFPEYGQALYTAPTGGAVVFSCSLLHEATPVTSGRRYMYLPFLYDEAARQIRIRNLEYMATASTDVAEA